MATVLAIDQGTSSTRAVVYDTDLRVLGAAQEAVACAFPRPGWVEQDAESLLTSVVACARRALAAARLDAARLAGIGLASQRETTVLWERATGRACAPAIVWQDRRTAEACAHMRAAGAEALVRARTGLVCDPYFSASKIAWLLDRHDLRRAAERGELAAGTVDAWLLHRLCGVHVTDLSNASRTSLLDIGRLAWDDELLRLFAVPAGVLPATRATVDGFGVLKPELLGAAVPVRAVAGDQQAALYGQACLAPGQAKNTYGTGGFTMVQCGATRRDADGCLATVAWQLPGQPVHYALEGAQFLCGALVQWLRDGLGLIATAAEIESLAAAVGDADGVVIVPGHVGLGSPWWDAAATGLIIGCTRGTTRAHLARAALDALAQQVADVLDAMRGSGVVISELRVDGGACGNDLLMQRQAALAEVAVRRPVDRESTVRGAGALALLGAGLTHAGRLYELWQEERIWPAGSPAPGERDRWRRAVARSRGWNASDGH